MVTGGAGYIGSMLVDKLASKNDVERILVYDNLSRDNYDAFIGGKIVGHEKIKFIHGDILDSRKLRQALEGIDVVYHLAAKVTTPFANTDPHYYEQVNHWGTAELVYAIEESSVQQVIYSSSMSVYGASKDTINEQTQPNPKTYYGISKLRGEEHLQRLLDRLNTQVFRCGNVYGFSRTIRFDAVINRFVFEANFNHKLTINGDGKQHRAFIHINTLTEVLAQVPFVQVPSGVYNLFTSNYTVLDIVEALKELDPNLEFMFVNQHMSLRQLLAEPDLRIGQYLDVPEEGHLKQQLSEFLSHFAY